MTRPFGQGEGAMSDEEYHAAFNLHDFLAIGREGLKSLLQLSFQQRRYRVAWDAAHLRGTTSSKSTRAPLKETQ